MTVGDPTPLAAFSDQLAKIAEMAMPSVVHIQSEVHTAQRGIIEETGSGVIVAGSRVQGNFVVTNSHVIADAELKNIAIQLGDGREIHPDRVWIDRATDLAVLRINADDVRPAQWGDSDEVKIGHVVLAVGSPFGLSQSITFGIVSAKGRRSLSLGERSEVINQNFLQTDAAINPGNSGGPLIDLYGRVVGINTAIASNSGGNEGIGFSIPSNLVRRVFDELLLNNKVSRAYLGVKLDAEFDLTAAQKLKLDRVRGARVTEVYPNTPASRANLKFNDVVLSFDGVDVQDENHLINLVSLTTINKAVRLVLWRDGRSITVEVTLGNRDDLTP